MGTARVGRAVELRDTTRQARFDPKLRISGSGGGACSKELKASCSMSETIRFEQYADARNEQCENGHVAATGVCLTMPVCDPRTSQVTSCMRRQPHPLLASLLQFSVFGCLQPDTTQIAYPISATNCFSADRGTSRHRLAIVIQLQTLAAAAQSRSYTDVGSISQRHGASRIAAHAPSCRCIGRNDRCR